MIRTIRPNLLSIIILFFLGAAVYSNTLNSSFHFDDFSFILGNDAIRKITDPGAIWYYWPTRFFGLFSFAINYQVGQFAVFGYHLFNLVLHILTAILVFIFTALTFSTPVMSGKEIAKCKGVLAFFAAAVFLSHPIQTQAVNYIFQRVTILATFFYLTSLCLYIQAMFLIKAKRWIAIFCYGLSLVVAIMGMFTKEIFFTLPVMILFYDFCFLRTNDRWWFKYTIPFLAMLPIIPLTVFFQTPFFLTPLASTEIHRFLVSSFLDIVLNFLTQCRGVMTYLRLLVLPFNQNLDYGYPLVKVLWDAQALVSFCFLAAVFVITIRIFSKLRLLAFSIFWFFIALTVESTIIPMTDVINEHRLYLPMVGASIFIVSTLYYLLGKRKITLMVVVLLFVVFFCSVFTYKRNQAWKNEIVLWSDAVNKSPKKVRPYNNRGAVYSDHGEYDKAIIDFSRVLELNRDSADGYYNRGLAYQRKGEYDKAVCDYAKAIAINPKYLKAYINRGQVYSANKEYEKSASDFRRVIEIAPLDKRGYFNLAYLYVTLGKKEEAISSYNKILEIDPNNAEVYYNLGVIYADKVNKREAVELFKKALERDPRYTPAFDKLVKFYAGKKDKGQLMALYEKAIANKLDNFDAYYNTGNLYSSIGKDKDAIVLYRRAVEINPGSANAYAALGSSYCLLGNNKMAALFLKKAVQLNPNLGAAHNNLAVAYYYNKDYDLAIEHCNRAIGLGYKVNPKLPQLLRQHRQ